MAVQIAWINFVYGSITKTVGYIICKINIPYKKYHFLFFVAKWAICKFRYDVKYNNKKFDTIKMKQMLKIELKSNTALITKYLLKKYVGKLA